MRVQDRTKLSHFVDWKDAADRFYIRYLGDPPEIRVVRLGLDG